MADAEKILQSIIGRLSGNNRPIIDYLENDRADYLPINQLIPIINTDEDLSLRTESLAIINLRRFSKAKLVDKLFLDIHAATPH